MIISNQCKSVPTTVSASFRSISENQPSLVAPLTYNTGARTDLIGRDVAAVDSATKKQNWIDKMTEFAETLNGGSTGAAPAIPLQIFALLDSSLKSGYYKVRSLQLSCSAVTYLKSRPITHSLVYVAMLDVLELDDSELQ